MICPRTGPKGKRLEKRVSTKEIKRKAGVAIYQDTKVADLPTTKSKVETNQPKRILYFEVKVTSFQYSASRLRSLKPRTKYCDGEETTSFLDVVLL